MRAMRGRTAAIRLLGVGSLRAPRGVRLAARVHVARSRPVPRRRELPARPARDVDRQPAERLLAAPTRALRNRDHGGLGPTPRVEPRHRPLAAAELDAPGGASTTAFASPPDAPLHPHVGHLRVRPRASSRSESAAFSRYPVQLAPYASVGSPRARPRRSTGCGRTPSRGVGGLVRAQMADGSPASR